MKKSIILFILLFNIILSSSYAQKDLPVFAAKDIYGEIHNLSNYLDDGKYVFLDFFTLTCGPCQTEAPKVDNVYRDYGCNYGDVIFMAIECSYGGNTTNEQIFNFCQQFSLSFDAVSGKAGGRNIAELYEIYYTPYNLLISPDYEIVAEHIYINSEQVLTDTLAYFGLNNKTCEGSEIYSYELIVDNDTIMGNINREDKIINIQVPVGADLNNCVALFVGSSNSIAYVDNQTQESGESVNDFSALNVSYNLIAENSDFVSYWNVIIEELNKIDIVENNFTFYPNPAKDFICISQNNNIIDKIEIINNMGVIVDTENIIDNKINISNLENGIYFLKVYKNNEIFIEKINVCN